MDLKTLQFDPNRSKSSDVVLPNVEIKEVNTKDIAIIGMAVNLPNTPNLNVFWEKLKQGICTTGQLSQNRKNDILDYIRLKNVMVDDIVFQKGSYLEEIDKFDYRFFHLTPREACLINPIQRLFLETAWNAIEDAGYGGDKLKLSNTGVYVGYMGDTEGFKYMEMITEAESESSLPISVPGNIAAIIPSRISYLLDLKGPSMLVDTACSSSLTAVHIACQAIRNEDCDLAIVGSAKIYLLPNKAIKLGMESSDGITRTFDNNSDGTGIGEGVAAIILKPLHKALHDKDNIYAIIKGSAVNQDGTTMGITAPNSEAQADVIVKAWNNAGVNPESITYIEAHGTATKLGDPVEVDAINKAFQRFTDRKQFCAIRSVKTNIGHLNEAAGIIGLITAALTLKYKHICPNVHFYRPNQRIRFEDSPVYVNDKLSEWATQDTIRRCGVSSFGFSGTNCHVILEEFPGHPESKRESPDNRPKIFTLSAKSEAALHELISQYYHYIKVNMNLDENDICYTVNTGRGHYNFRLAFIFETIVQLRNKLQLLSEVHDLSMMKEPIDFNYSHYDRTDDFNSTGPGETFMEIIELSETAGEKITEFLNSRRDDRDLLSQILNLYINGANIRWEVLYHDQKVKKISLPSYPLARERCWINYPDRQEVQYNLGTELMIQVNHYLSTNKVCFQNVTAGLKEIESFGALLLFKAFMEMGFKKDVVYLKDQLKSQLGILERYDRLFEALLFIMDKEGYIQIKDGQINTNQLIIDDLFIKQLQHLPREKERLVRLFPDKKPFLQLLDICVANFQAILTGRKLATEVMFPSSAMNYVEGVYKGNQAINICNELMAICVKEYFQLHFKQNVHKTTEFKIIEIGAGTGGATLRILEYVSPYSEKLSYYYTDVSLGFTNYGKTHFGTKYSFIKFQELNIEKDIEQQGFAPNDFDVLIASNVIHATRDINRTLVQVKKLLKPNGLFLMNETTLFQYFTTLTFGLLDGWWLYQDQDTDLRIKNSPLLAINNWEQVLCKNEFENVKTVEVTDEAGEAFGQSIIFGFNIVQPGFKNRANSVSSNPRVFEMKLMKQTRNTSVTETRLAEIWKEVLGFGKIDVEENFFEVGGDSILFSQLQSVIEREFSINLNIAQMFAYPTISKMAHYIDELTLKTKYSTGKEPNSDAQIQHIFDLLAKGSITLEEALLETKQNLKKEEKQIG